MRPCSVRRRPEVDCPAMALLDWITPDPSLKLQGSGVLLRAAYGPREAVSA